MTKFEMKEILEEFLIDAYRERLFLKTFDEILDECDMKGIDYEFALGKKLDTEDSL